MTKNDQNLTKMPPKNAHKHLSPTSAGAPDTPSCGVGGPGAPAELGVVLKSLTFGVSPVAISLVYPEFISMCYGVPVTKVALQRVLRHVSRCDINHLRWSLAHWIPIPQ